MEKTTVLNSVKGHRYRLHWSPEKLLYQGKYSTVVLADDELDNWYAAKIIQETTAVHELSLPVTHSVLLPPQDVCLFEKGLVYFIPYFAGQSLTGFLDTSVADERGDLVADVFGQLAAGFGALHQAGWYHGDVKPGNLLARVGKEGKAEVRIIDFGKASPIGALRSAGSGFNLQYASPEVILSAGTVTDQRTDIYSLALIIYEWLEGRHPFLHAHPEMMLHLMMAAPLPVPKNVKPGVKEVLMRALQKPVFPRPPSMLPAGEVKERLQQAAALRWERMEDFFQALLAFPEGLKPASAGVKRAWWKW